MKKQTLLPFFVALVLALSGPGLAAAIKVVPDRADGIYAPGQPVVWTVTAGKDDPGEVRYAVKKDGQILVSEGLLNLTKGPVTITATRSDPGSLQAFLVSPADAKEKHGAGGAIFAPEKIGPAVPAPADFDAFWKSKLAELAAIPVNPVLEQVSGLPKPGNVDYHKVTLDNIRGTKVRGQLARPSAPGGKYPAIITFQYAGVYPLKRDTVINDARAGWLALNISAHDLPIDEPPEFYKEQEKGALKGYIYKGSQDRETSYFLRMLLGCVRAIDYLTSRPDWDGRTLLVTGTSQGGLQAFAAAGLSDKVTGLIALVPAGCDNHAPRAGRAFGWPFWLSGWGGGDRAKVESTAGYFDGIHFAARVRCPSLVAYGLIDTTARPTGIAAAINALQGPKETVVLTLSDHRGNGDVRKSYQIRVSAWKKAARTGAALPPAQ
ncbi:acetyl esterase (deacetylase) [Opitutaceae bacterium TAV1]|nr:acetyl esterase (deacetylase) [Opitutaceae bacterium TAV1]